MKKFLLIFCCIIGSMQTARAMEAILYGAAVPALAGLYYTATSSKPIDQKVGQWAMITGGGAIAGGASKLLLCALIANPATAATATAFTAAAIGCGITGLWALEKTLPRYKK